MKYIITGHKGLIGSALKKRLDKLGHKCLLKIDERESKKVQELDMYRNYRADIFFHCASNCKINQTIKYPHLSQENVDSTFEALEYCRRNSIRKFIYFSSSRVLSKEKNPYTASKIYGEELCEAYKDCYGIDYIIIRPSTVYGGEDETNRLMNIWINNALNDEALKLFGNADKTLDFTYIDDFLDALFLIIKHNRWNEAFNISGGNELYLIDVADEIIKQVGKGFLYLTEEEMAQPQRVKLDIKKLLALGYKPKVNIREGIRREICRLTS